ncbi:MAG: methyltransferase domain-containing protein [Gammaproteobacteria bacterium]|jgi:cyclopropane-fatty-acyl-phospholipid synthase|nr:methyltransferase domain-containing protein [Gammaproteobacteria bacterium]
MTTRVSTQTAPAPVSTPLLLRPLLSRLERITHGSLDLELPGGERLRFAGPRPGPEARLEVRDNALFWRLAWSGDVGFGEAYRDGLWDTPDLAGLLTFAALNRDALDDSFHGSGVAQRVLNGLHRLRANSRSGSRRNIRAHYDIGNDFYRLWLDPALNYSAAIFEDEPGRTLEEAQLAKHDRILDQLGAVAGESVLEVGCGWGAFARRAASTRGCLVEGISLSREQLRWARREAVATGLTELSRYDYLDYRDVETVYDHAVSIEMFEAVGESHWPGYFARLHGAVRPGGRAVVQSITIDEALFDGYRRRSDFIQRHIFPGGMLPTPSRFHALAAQAGWRVVDDFAFGLDYAETLRRWRLAFGAARDALEARGYDRSFRRLWAFYLAYCEAGFRAGSIDVHQFTLVREG